jgi:hypothetical protein
LTVQRYVELRAVADVIVPAFAGRVTVYLQARTQYGIVDPADLRGLGELWRAVLGDDDLRALDELYARIVWIPDGELERLDEAAREHRRIVGEPDPPTSAGGAGDAGGSGEGGGDADPDEGDGPDPQTGR